MGETLALDMHSTTAPATPFVECSGDEQFSSAVIWSPTDTGGTSAWFLPKSLLQATPFEKWPLREPERRALNYYLGGWEEFQRDVREQRGINPDRCNHAPEPDPPGSHVDASSLEEQILRKRSVSFVSTVVDEVLGLYVPLQQVATAVYVEVDEVLNSTEQRVKAGDVVSFISLTGGRIDVESGPLCTLPPATQFVPQEHARVLVSGDFILHLEHHVAAMIVAPIQNGIVHLQENPHLREQQSLDLNALRQVLNHVSDRGTP